MENQGRAGLVVVLRMFALAVLTINTAVAQATVITFDTDMVSVVDGQTNVGTIDLHGFSDITLSGADADFFDVSSDNELKLNWAPTRGIGKQSYQVDIVRSQRRGDRSIRPLSVEVTEGCPVHRITQVDHWHLFSVPCVAPEGKKFGDLVQAEGMTMPEWKAWSYNTTSSSYQALTADSPIPQPGVGFWFISSAEVTLEMPSGSLQIQADALVTLSGEGWNLHGNPLIDVEHYGDVKAMNINTNCNTSPCALEDLPTQAEVTPALWQYDTGKEKYIGFGLEATQMKVAMPWAGYWARFSHNGANVSGLWKLQHEPYSVPLPPMIDIPAGDFTMGSPEDEPERDTDENQHEVTIENAFKMGKYEVTFAQYDAFAEATGRVLPDDSTWGRDNRPVMNVSWVDATAYAVWLTEQTGLPYRLPTEAEWEYAARAGTTTPFHTGETINSDQANFNRNEGQTVEVGMFGPNAFGLHDVHGNVWEWICSRYQASYSAEGQVWNECAAEDGGFNDVRVLRGGSWNIGPWFLRAANRIGLTIFVANKLNGFRLTQD